MSDRNNKTLIVILGPTAVGKTQLSLNLAQTLGTVVLSADSRQFYHEMAVGTAKPTDDEMGDVRHFFVNSRHIWEDYSVQQFEHEATALLGTLFQQHDEVVVAGGSGLFIKALCEGLDDIPDIPEHIREALNNTLKHKGLSHLQDRLKAFDPDIYQKIDTGNPRRIIRALEVLEFTGKSIGYYQNKVYKDRPFNILKIGLERERENLYKRIEIRMDIMLEQGLKEEAIRLSPFRHLNALQTVGYSEIFNWLSGAYEWEEAVRLLKRNSRRYAKRQMTWFKKDTTIHWFDADNTESVKKFVQQTLSDMKT